MTYTRVCVLMSGGIESAVLMGYLDSQLFDVYPVRVHVGYRWEDAEERVCRDFLQHMSELNMSHPRDLHIEHAPCPCPSPRWATSGDVPAAGCDDRDVFLPRRNETLLCAAARVCAASDIHTIAIGTLAGNPFPDATPIFFRQMSRMLSDRHNTTLSVVAPFQAYTKKDVMKLGFELGVPIWCTISCLRPDSDGRPCGECNKCDEHARAFDCVNIASI